MIAFDLQCSKGHTFEGWFEDSRSFDDQKEKGMITCPVCNDTDVTKIPSTFAIKSYQDSKQMETVRIPPSELGEKIIEYVDKNFDDVGSDFAREALKMHYGVSEPRNIRGVSTQAEEKTLKEEGIQYFKLPLPPQKDYDA